MLNGYPPEYALLPIQFSQIFDTEIYWAFGDIRNDTDSIAIKIFNI